MLLLAALTVGLPPATAEAAPITGRAQVVDGNTLEVAGRRIRLHGIDAPDAEQLCQDGGGRDYACGQDARAALSARVAAADLTCETLASEPGQRASGICRIGADDINAWMVVTGYAVAVGGPDAAYAGQDRRAWGRRAGLWSGAFEEPAQWRARQHRVADRAGES